MNDDACAVFRQNNKVVWCLTQNTVRKRRRCLVAAVTKSFDMVERVHYSFRFGNEIS